MTDTKSNKNKLLYVFKDDSLKIQSKSTFLQANFLTPILQAYQFLQRYEKYCCKSQLLSIPIKATQFDQYYNEIKKHIEQDFDTFMQTAMNCIQQLILNTLYYRIQKWHFYTKSIEILKRQILNKDIDCYGFDVKQFDRNFDRVIEIIENSYTGVINRSQSTKIEMQEYKQQIIKYQKCIEEAQSKIINKQMFVQNPYKAQNAKNEEIDANQLLLDYLQQVQILQEPLNISFKVKQFKLQKTITQFYKKTLQHTKQLQIALYNQSDSYKNFQKMNSINNGKLISKQQFESNSFKKSQKNYCLDNRILEVSFQSGVTVFDDKTKDFYVVQKPQLSYYRKTNQIYKLQNIQQHTIPISSEYFDIWDHMYDRSKLRKLHHYKQNIARPEQNLRQLVIKNMKQESQKFSFREINEENQNHYHRKQNNDILMCIYSDIFRLGKQQDKKLEQKHNNKQKYTYIQQNRKSYKNVSYNDPRKQQQRQKNDIEKQREVYLYRNNKYQKQHQNQIQIRIKNACLSKRNYKNFCQTMGIQYKQPTIQHDRIINRYGMKLQKDINLNQPSILQQFLCFYIRQKLYRYNESINDKKTNFLFYYSKSIKKFCSKSSIKFLIKKITEQKYKRYVLWGPQIIVYEERITPAKIKQADFTIYTYSEQIYSQRIMFQLRRYSPYPIKQNIITRFYQKKSTQFYNVLSKFQNVSRLVLNTHLLSPDSQISQNKGKQLFDKMINSILQYTQ